MLVARFFLTYPANNKQEIRFIFTKKKEMSNEKNRLPSQKCSVCKHFEILFKCTLMPITPQLNS